MWKIFCYLFLPRRQISFASAYDQSRATSVHELQDREKGLEDRVPQDPLEVAVDASVEARVVGFSTADTPGHHADHRPAPAGHLVHEGPAAVTLTNNNYTFYCGNKNTLSNLQTTKYTDGLCCLLLVSGNPVL